jgi:mannan endo-1,4-beta-mannosidase
MVLYYQKANNYSSIDYGTTHCWVQNWGIYDMLNSSSENLEAAKDFAEAFIADSSQWVAKIGKLIFVEEFGMARNNWENVDKEYKYLSSAGTSNKDEYFEVSSLPCLEIQRS